MATKPLLPVHSKNQNLKASIATKTILRLTEKYVLAIALVAFSLVFLGAFYLPQDKTVQPGRIKRGMDSLGLDVGGGLIPKADHEHGPGDHKDQDIKAFMSRVKNDKDLNKMVDGMEQQLEQNHNKIEKLNDRLSKLVSQDKNLEPPLEESEGDGGR